MIKNVIWDFDGTLFDTYPAIVHAFIRVLRENFGLDYSPDAIREFLQIGTKHCTLHLGRTHSLDPDVVLARVWEYYHSQTSIPEAPYESAKRVCEEIAKRGVNALVTHRDRASTLRMLTQFDMQQLFTIIVTADDGFPFKPASDSFDHVIQVTSMMKHETLGVGDRNLDVEAALASGIHSAFFSPDGRCHAAAEFNIRTLADILVL